MNKIPTAEEFAKKGGSHIMGYPVLTVDAAIEFAKLHVQAALEEARFNVDYYETDDGVIIKAESILNAYPLDNIK